MTTWVVASHYQEDLRWLEGYRLPVVVVSKEGGDYSRLRHDAYLNVHRMPNRMREAGSYLWFLVNYWNHLPDRMFFIHGHQRAYHQTLSLDEAVARYSDRSGYADFNEFSRLKFVNDGGHGLFGHMWERIFRGDLGPEPDEIHFDYGSQFRVDRDTVARRPLGFYRNAYDAALDISGYSDEIGRAHV